MVKNTSEYNKKYYEEHKKKYQEIYNRKQECETCGKQISKSNFSKHLKSKVHLNKITGGTKETKKYSVSEKDFEEFMDYKRNMGESCKRISHVRLDKKK